MNAQRYIFLGIFLCCVAFINIGAGATVASSNAVNTVYDDLVVKNLLRATSLLQKIPLVGSLLYRMHLPFVNMVGMFEGMTNHFFDRIVRNSLPCTLTDRSLQCEGIWKNGGMHAIVRDAIDSMPDTMAFEVIKIVLGLLLCYFSSI